MRDHQKQTKRVSIVVSLEAYNKILYIMKKERVKSLSSMSSRLIEEALEKYSDRNDPELPL